jgi:chloramphenicol 3-O-phosphotransferase
MPPTLIALAGSSRSGKGTCAAVFAEEAAKRMLQGARDLFAEIVDAQ